MSPGIVTGSPASIVVDQNLGSMFSFCSIASEICILQYLGQVANDDSYFLLGLPLAYAKMNSMKYTKRLPLYLFTHQETMPHGECIPAFVGQTFSCKVCGKHFQSKVYRDKHFNIHLEARYGCKFCEKQFVDSSNRNAHEKNVHNRNKMECPKCDKEFRYKKTLRDHQKMVHNHDNQNSHPTSAFLQKRPKIRELEDKITVLEKEQEKLGKTVNDMVATIQNLREEVIQSLEKKIVEMEKVTWKQEAEREANLKNVQSELKISQDEIFRLTEENALLEATVLNAGPSSEKCYQEAESINDMIITYDNGTKYVCTECGKLFKDKKYYLVHYKSHFIGKQFMCKKCGKEFEQKKTLKRHKLYFHLKESDKIACNQCGKQFKHPQSLKDHLVLHDQSAPYDGRQKTYPNELKKEALKLLEIHGKAEVARILNVSYRAINNWETANKKKFICHFCEKQLCSEQSLKRHESSKHEDKIE